MKNTTTSEESFLPVGCITNNGKLVTTRETVKTGLRCPYCCADISRSFREFPVMGREDYAKHVSNTHDVPKDLALRQYNIRIEWDSQDYEQNLLSS